MTLPQTLPKTFDPKAVEAAHYEAWEASGLMACDPDSSKPPFAMMMPPPNVTGSLHMGHAFQDTLMDILVRYYRMKGRDALWQPGTDHAGIATQMVVERQLEAKGQSRKALGREKFLDKVWAWKKHSGGQITTQLRRLGVTPDWARERFTMDEGLSAAVRKVFVQLYREGLIYKDKRLVNWNPKMRTAVSDLEVHAKDVKGKMWHIAYPVEGAEARTITVATTRPETMLGDTAVAVHPDDDRYKDLIGRSVALPLTDRLIPIIADDYADPEQGSGAVKITPAHDFNDFEVGRRHALPMIRIFDDGAHLNENAPEEFRGLDRFAARKAILAELEAQELLVSVENITHAVPYDEKSKEVVLEPHLTEQWYLNDPKLAPAALKAVKDSRTRFVPAQWENTYTRWLEELRPWCISRQLWWGHQIPAWYDADGNIYVAESQAEAQAQAGEGVALTQETDVLDTWFSAALWPFGTLGWPKETPELARYYPGDVLVTGFDIIFFWVARMMMMGIHFMGDVPFRTVYIHAIVRDAQGQKMSKTRGNVIDPLDLCDEYGADALRFTLAAMAAPGRDVKLAESRVAGYRNFATKLWNAARYCEMREITICDAPDEESALSRWILSELDAAREAVGAAIEAYQFNAAADAAYHFVWHTFCDWYLEFTKDAPEPRTTGFVLGEILRLLNPFMPFVTEELYQKLTGRADILAAGPWLAPRERDAQACEEIQRVVDMISAIRSVRKDVRVPDKARPDLYVTGVEEATCARMRPHYPIIARMAGLGEIHCCKTPPGDVVRTVAGAATLSLPIGGIIDAAAEGARLRKEIESLDKEIAKVSKKLDNPKFIDGAPAEIVAGVRAKRAGAQEKRQRLADALTAMGG